MYVKPEERDVGISREGMPLDEASKLLLKAATFLERNHWCQAGFRDGIGGYCLIGAIRMADHGDHNYSGCTPVGKDAHSRVLAAFGGFSSGPAEWNDTPGRTKEEVIAKLRAVALGG